MPSTPSGLLFSAAAERNQAAINTALSACLPGPASVLEIASGSGQHAEHLCRQHVLWTWQPTDADARVLPAIATRCEALVGVKPPVQVDVLATLWPLPSAHFDAVFCANLLHISPVATIDGLMRGAANHLRAGGMLLLYGPFLEQGVPTAAGNLVFDADLRSRNPLWGLRDLDSVQQVAQAHGLTRVARYAMPANNLLLQFRLGH